MRRRFLHLGIAALVGAALALVLLSLGAATPVSANPGIHCVNQSGTNCASACDGGCHASVQAAVDAAIDGDLIRIAGGHYTPGGTVAAINKPLTLEGAYDSTCGTFDPDMHETILDAEWGGPVISITNAGEVMLHFLTLTHGDGSGTCAWGGCGGGVYASGSHLYVGCCFVTGNVGNTGDDEGMGGGIYAHDGTAQIWGSRIVSNTANVFSEYAGFGGGIYAHYMTAVSVRENAIQDNAGHATLEGLGGGVYLWVASDAELLTNTIRGNYGSRGTNPGNGGGVYLQHSSVVLSGNLIDSNQAQTNPYGSGAGGGVYVLHSDVHLTRNRIVGNAARAGAAARIVSTDPVTLSNNLIANNETGSNGSGVQLVNYSPPGNRVLMVNNTIAHSGDNGIVVTLYYGALTMTNNLVTGHDVGLDTQYPFTGTITADHNLFWNTSDPITGSNGIREDPLLTSRYYPGEDSPALDQGLDIVWLTVDLEGNPRPSGAYDLGAFEGVRWDVTLPLVLRSFP
jgi:hypothetical protein